MEEKQLERIYQNYLDTGDKCPLIYLFKTNKREKKFGDESYRHFTKEEFIKKLVEDKNFALKFG